MSEQQTIEPGVVSRQPVCLYQQDEDGNWNTDCGECWVLVEGTPKENRMRFCPYCGLSLRQRSYRG